MSGEGIDRTSIGIGEEPRAHRQALDRLDRTIDLVRPELKDPLAGSPAADLVLEANRRAQNRAV